MTAPDAPLSTRELAGYRILRSLARDEQAEVLLGHRSTTSGGDDRAGAAGDVETVALKVFDATAAGWESAARLCAVLERARGPHVVDLLDVDGDERNVRLVFARLTRGDLAGLLGIRSAWEGGEAVTILAPIVTTLQRLHRAGIAHGAVSPRTVMFRDDGAPTLIGFSRAELFAPDAPEVVLEEIAEVLRDRAAVRELAVTVLERVRGTRERAARELLAALEEIDDELVLPFLAARLFGMAAALAVRFAAEDPVFDAVGAVSRLVPVSAAVPSADPDRAGRPDEQRSSRGSLGGVIARLVRDAAAQHVLDAAQRSAVASILGEFARRWSSWPSRRRRVVLAGAAAALTVVVVMAVVPASGSARGTQSVPLVARSHPAGSRTADSSAARSTTTGSAESARDRALGGDDPLAAAVALLTARNRCLASLSVLCLDGVDEAGSGALVDDRAAIRVAQQGGELPDALETVGSTATAPELVERLGDSALVHLGQGPASLLLVKGESGWLIRDVIAAVQDPAD